MARGEALELIARCVAGCAARGSAGAVGGDDHRRQSGGFRRAHRRVPAGLPGDGLRPGMSPGHLEYVLSDDIDVLVVDESGRGPRSWTRRAACPYCAWRRTC
ncbi:hypothetical protein NKH77_27390 [Streptomyces sp. M19]